ncbi:hydroxyacylglutathione hydrolase [Catalinimonas alkaloidigena]|uniref:MBL fold metallo-hydrolase n=1 Tax=Catalinimonas alkaloidigena TaxID=1075417 RepID=UPI002407726F|nr:MBL fold metallo-hydrolase [Catalinimonas alkaloidigena]MDF9798815.1 hydroxyacylglutathione hydrolase [Catalinimonas alkaloidigena]
MEIEQIYTGCLAQGAYYIESAGEAAIVDPLRESEPYIKKAEKEGAKVKYIFETHFHADFVSGHVDLAAKTGATIVYGPNAKTEYDIHEAKDGEIFELGKVKIKVLHTPGHTMESTTYLLIDEEGKEHAIFSGDTLFIGDVGRPDLAQKGALTQNDLAGYLYDSLRNKIMTLPDDVVVYPAHGAGSACGKNMSKETTDLLGNQKKTNYALRANMSKEEFIKEVTEGLLPPPRYFAQNVAMNKSGAKGLSEILEKGNVPLDADTFEAIANHEGAVVLDTRSPEEFAASHIPNAIFIGIDGSFAPWVGALIPDLQQAMVFIAPEGREEEVITRLSRVGYDNTLGYLQGGLEAWTAAGKETDSVTSISAPAFAGKLKEEEHLNVVDVRKPTEYQAEHVEGAESLPLDYISENMEKVDKEKTYHLHCAGGYRSMIAASILKSRGYQHIVDISGGFKAISETDIPTTDYVCPSTLK